MALSVKFWGVRGSIACASPDHVVFGGNTSCLEVMADGQRIILDAGTGIRDLGRELLVSGVKETVIFLTHVHWDHISGFPFFAPAFTPGFKLDIYAGHLMDAGGVENVFSGQMANPTFPVPLSALQADITFNDFRAGENVQIFTNINIATLPLNHPNGATGYRISCAGKSICYITDTEHIVGELDQSIVSFIKGADLVVYDSTYTDAQFSEKIGWGHSTWEEGVRLCRAAEAKKIAIFHHDPDHDDKFMFDIERQAKNAWEGAVVAREQMSIALA